MVRSGTPEPADGGQTLGDLVATAVNDVSQLVRYEIQLAKSELRSELRRVTVAGALLAIAAFFGVLMLFCLCFTYAYLLYWAGAPGGMAGAFGFVFLTLGVLGAILGFIAVRVLRHMTGMKKTRDTVTDDIAVLRRDDKTVTQEDPQTASAAFADGKRPQIAGHESR